MNKRNSRKHLYRKEIFLCKYNDPQYAIRLNDNLLEENPDDELTSKLLDTAIIFSRGDGISINLHRKQIDFLLVHKHIKRPIKS